MAVAPWRRGTPWSRSEARPSHPHLAPPRSGRGASRRRGEACVVRLQHGFQPVHCVVPGQWHGQSLDRSTPSKACSSPPKAGAWVWNKTPRESSRRSFRKGRSLTFLCRVTGSGALLAQPGTWGRVSTSRTPGAGGVENCVWVRLDVRVCMCALLVNGPLVRAVQVGNVFSWP